MEFCLLCVIIFQQDWCDGPMRQLLEDKDKRTDAQAIRDCFKTMFENLFASGTRAQSTSQIRGNDFGPIRKKFAQVTTHYSIGKLSLGNVLFDD